VGEETNYTFIVKPTTLDPITNAAVVGSFTSDPDLTNNTALGVSTVATNTPPAVNLQQTNVLAVRGASASLQVAAFGVPPLTYQWLFNGHALLGETANVLSLTNVQPDQSGAYSVVVTNANGSITSPPVQLTVVLAPTIQLAELGPAGSSFSVTFTSAEGLSYSLEYKNALTDATWTPLLPATTGTGGLLSLQDTNSAVIPTRFYRITAQ
jgi:hypothetical protein